MSRLRGDDVVYASDGLIARVNGPWAKEKLSFLDDFVPPALQATTKKLQRVYLDLFAGPGKNVDAKSTGEEFDGSALRVLPMRSPNDPRVFFSRAILINKNEHDHLALEERVNALFASGVCPMPRKNVHVFHADTNLVIHRVMTGIAPRAYIFVFADMESPRQLPWSTVEALRMHGHTSVDLYLLFPLDMAINRMISYERDATEANAMALTTFYGSEDWRSIAGERITDSQSPRLRRGLLDLYMLRLRGLGWSSVRVVREVQRRGRHALYKMIYATNHPAGENISSWSADRTSKKQQLGFDLH